MATNMTSRERLLGALRHTPTDRVPISTYELHGLDLSGPFRFYHAEPSYARLLAFIREKTDSIYMWGMPALHRMHPDIRVERETREIGKGAETRETIHTPKGPLTATRLRKPGVHTTWTTEHLLKGREDIERYMSIEWVRREEPPDYGPFHEMDRQLGGRGLPGPDTGDALCGVASLFSFEDFTIFAFTETELLQAMIEAAHKRIMERLRRALDAGVYGLFRIYGSEYASEPYLPPRIWETLEKPYLREMIQLIQSRENCFARLHSHGRLRGILPHILDCGPAALEPCEPPPDGDLTLAELKATAGDRICLMGAMELRMLETGTPEQIREEVRRSVEMAGEGGGYIAVTTATASTTPLAAKTEANYIAWIEANLAFGLY